MDSILGTTILFTIASPIILIHGYAEDSSVWDSWIGWLESDGFENVYPITFSNDDECGTVKQHATELQKQIAGILNATHSDKVNIVAHSKGGLDARWYVSQNPGKVENLIMIGTPNTGSAAAYIDVTTCAFEGSATGREDMQPGSVATTQSADQTGTHYYTVAGDYAVPCYLVIQRPLCYVIDNDGFVTVDSAKSNYTSLGVFHYNHNALVTQQDVYQKILPYLIEP